MFQLNIAGISVCEVCSRESSSSAAAATASKVPPESFSSTAAAMASKVPPGWACVTCTFLNTAGDFVCEMCGTDMQRMQKRRRMCYYLWMSFLFYVLGSQQSGRVVLRGYSIRMICLSTGLFNSTDSFFKKLSL